MQDSKIDRRAPSPSLSTHDGSAHADPAQVVRQGIMVQASQGTLSAVEFLKQQGVQGAVIQRVLTGEQVRLEDQRLLGPEAR